MIDVPTRRQFLKTAAVAGATAGLGDFSFLRCLPRVAAEEAKMDSKMVRFHPDIEPLVRFLEETPRERLLEEVAARIHHGLTYRELLAALLLAGARNIQPRPRRVKFHAVMGANPAHLPTISRPGSRRG